MFFVMLGFGIIIPNLAYYAEDIGATPTKIAILMSIYSGMQLLFAPIWGRLSDRYGRKPAILLGLLGNAGALVGFGLAKNYSWLFIARSAAGHCFSSGAAECDGLRCGCHHIRRTRKGMGFMGAAMGLGFILGPAIGGVMGAARCSLLCRGWLVSANLSFALILLPESLQLPSWRGGSDYRRAGTRHCPYNISRMGISPRTIPQKNVDHLRSLSLFLVAFFSTFSFAGLEATFPLFIEKGWDYGQKEMGWMFMFMGVIVVPLQGGLLGTLINRFGERRLILTGLLLNALGMALLLRSPSFLTLTVYLTIAGIGNQLIRPTNTSWISKQTRIGQGTAIGIMDAFLSLGRILGPLLGGWLYEKHTTYPYAVLAGLLVNCHLLSVYPFTKVSCKWRKIWSFLNKSNQNLSGEKSACIYFGSQLYW